MAISSGTRKAYSELDELLNLLDDELRNMVPEQLRELFNREKDNQYVKGINPEISIKEQNLLEETLTLIAWLNLEYWCRDEAEKERLKKIYLENEKKYIDKMKNSELFQINAAKSSNAKGKTIENLPVETQKSNVFVDFFRRIINFLKK